MGKEAEVGVNIPGLTLEHDSIVFHDDEAPYKPLFSLNAQKKFYIKNFDISLGGHWGFNRKGKTGTYLYANHINKIPKWKTKLLTGIYYSDRGYHGGMSRSFVYHPAFNGVGIQLGVESDIYKEKWLFQCDYLSGYHLSGSIVTGGAYVIKKVHVISFGYLVPLRDADAPDGIVLEYTYAPLSSSGKGG